MKWYYLPFIFIFLSFSLPTINFSSDMYCWTVWSNAFFEHGFVKGYEISGCNYLPLYMYVLKIYGWYNGSVEEIGRNINYLKLFTLVFDVLTIYLLINLLVKFNISPYKSFLVLFNIAFLYNSIIWGQVDSIFTFFGLASILFALNKKVLWSIIFLVLALNAKLQAIIFIPIVVIVLLPAVFENPRSLINGLIGGLIIQIVILLPFLLENKSDLVLKVAFGSVGYYPVVSMNAFNFWYLIMDGNLREVSDEILFYGIKYKTWGLILFFLFSFISLLPLLLSTLNIIIEKKEKSMEYYKIVFLAAAAIPLVFFYFNTEMHERYSHAMIIFIGFYALISSNYLTYFLLSAGYFLNMEKVLTFLSLKNYNTIIFDVSFISLLFLVGLISIQFQLYSNITGNELSFLKKIKLKLRYS
ncbi:hypothetical protein Emtol_1015 [Sporocytophaga myxococcoides]|uniref:Uncharacterized protein n=2 Tax=Sporocytophaga myxococcoides TaxID=153721 RepID=A0A098LM54_9BACT|nr:hypothetical protein Emtol_1015 [Sporocytophaga myxococcoides]